jgi:hypothetical protein
MIVVADASPLNYLIQIDRSPLKRINPLRKPITGGYSKETLRKHGAH